MLVDIKQRSTTVFTPKHEKSIAVLPFGNLSPDPADEYFADGLTDELITDLSPICTLHVIARASMMRFKRSGKDPLIVARELNVRYVLDGSVRRSGSSLRLTVRLIDAAADVTIWSDKLGGSVEDVFAMQEQVSRTIVEQLRLKLSPEEGRRLAERPIDDLRAYETYLQARQLMWTIEASALERARQLLTNALDLVGENSLLLSTLGWVHLFLLETGQAELTQQLEAADPLLRRLLDVYPLTFVNHGWVGYLEWQQGRYSIALPHFRRAYELEPNVPVIAWSYACGLASAGMKEEACSVVDRMSNDLLATPFGKLVIFLKHALRGEEKAALASVTPEFIAFARTQTFASRDLAGYYGMIGHVDEGLDWLETAIDLGYINYPFLAFHHPFYNALREHPRFSKVIERIKPRWEAFEA